MEVLGAVSSAVALAEIFTKSVLTMKKLWDEAQGVPEEINQLMNELTHLKPMLEEAETVFNKQAQNPSTDTALLLMHNYKEVSGKLHHVAADLNQRIVSAKKGKRSLTKLKATLSKNLIQRYQKELDSISQTLSFFFNVHNLHSYKESQALHLQSISLHRNTDDKVCQLLSLVQSHLLPQTMHNVQPSRLEGDPNNYNGNMIGDIVELTNQNNIVEGERRQKSQKPKPIAWHQRRLFGGFAYQTSQHPGKPATQVLQVRLELPWCLSGRAWDFEAYSSPMGWNMSIRPWTTRPNDDRIFDLVKKGSWPEVAEELKSGQASISDRNEVGFSLLDVALLESQFDVARSLVNLGFEIEGSGLIESIEDIWYFRTIPQDDNALVWFQCAAELGLLENLSEKLFNPQIDNDFTLVDICRHVWTTPELLSLFITERTTIRGEVSIFELFRTLNWYQTDPRFFLELCRNKGVSPQLFRESIMEDTWTPTLADFACAYFSYAPGRIVSGRAIWAAGRRDYEADFKYWKELAVWILTDVSVDDLICQRPGSSDPLGSNPFLRGLHFSGIPFLRGKDRSPRFIRLAKRRLTRTMRSWLEDVHVSGIDLSEYGQRQLEIHHSCYKCFWRWNKLSLETGLDFSRLYGPRLMSFTFGPRPQDWNLIWDPDVEELTGDFWELIENPPLHIPGAYPEDG